MLFRNSHGMFSIFFSSFLFGLMSVFIKILTTTVPASEILFFRALVGLLFVGALVYLHKASFSLHNINMLLVRGLVGGLAVFLQFMAIARIPLSSAILLANTYPLTATLFSFFLLKEKPRWDAILSLLVAFLGVFFILDPNYAGVDVGHLYALLAGMLGGLALTAIRELRKTDGSWVIVFSFLSGSLFFSLPLTISNFRFPNSYEWSLLLLVGVVTTVAQGYFTSSFKHVRVAEGSTLSLADTAFTIFFSVLILKETLTANFLFGALMVLGGSLYLIVRGGD